METIYFARKNENVKLPSKRAEDAAFDIYPYFDEDFIIILPHETKIIPTGLYSCCSSDYYIQLVERGSTGTKGIAQRCGVLDSGYRGEWFVPITNTTTKQIVISKLSKEDTVKAMCEPLGSFTLFNGMISEQITVYPYEKAISSAVLLPVPKVTVEELSVEELQAMPSERGEGKLGSSSK